MEQNLVAGSKWIKIPGPDHPITIERNPARIVVWSPDVSSPTHEKL